MAVIKRTIQRTPDMGGAVRMQPLQASPEGCEPAKVFDVDGALLAKLSCGEAFTCPASPPPPPPQGCDATRVGWSIGARTYYPSYVSSESPNAVVGLPWITIVDALDGWATTLQLEPPLPMTEMWGEPDAFMVIGNVVGAAIDGVTWEFAWDVPPMDPPPDEWTPPGNWLGHETEQIGGQLYVRILEWVKPDWMAAWIATLTATARCGDAVVGTLTLRVGFESGY